MPSTSLTDLTPDTQAAVAQLLNHAAAQGLTTSITATLRTCDEQNTLYQQGRTTAGSIVTDVQGCRSYHVLGRAVDIYIGSWICSDYAELGAFWKSLGGRWGGDFSFQDCVHFEWPNPNYDTDALCPSDEDCATAVATQPPAPMPSTPTSMAFFGALFGGALGLVVASKVRRRQA